MSADSKADDEITSAAEHIARMERLAYVGIVVAVAVVASFLFNFRARPISDDAANWGQFGDFVGGLLNPTFSFLALIALLATLGLQLKELRVSARELAASASALIQQNRTLHRQAFEATFFQLLRLHNDIVLSMETSAGSLKGRACFTYYVRKLKDRLVQDGASSRLDAALIHYELFYRDHQTELGHYFRLLYNILKLIRQSAEIDRQFYSNLVRAQLSSAELELLFFNCASSWGRDKFKPLVEEFALFKNFPDDDVPHERLLSAYSESAFGGRYPTNWL